jgi:hypothetical protein
VINQPTQKKYISLNFLNKTNDHTDVKGQQRHILKMKLVDWIYIE